MIDTLRKQLIYWSSVAISVSIILSMLIVYFIFKPLSVIKNAAEAIANGKFRKIEVINTRDEIQQVMETFNIMVSELERDKTNSFNLKNFHRSAPSRQESPINSTIP